MVERFSNVGFLLPVYQKAIETAHSSWTTKSGILCDPVEPSSANADRRVLLLFGLTTKVSIKIQSTLSDNVIHSRALSSDRLLSVFKLWMDAVNNSFDLLIGQWEIPCLNILLQAFGNWLVHTLAHCTLQCRIKSVFDSIVRSTSEQQCDSTPLVSDPRMHRQNYAIVWRWPVLLLHAWIQLIDPPLAGLLTGPVWQERCDRAPVAGAKPLYELS